MSKAMSEEKSQQEMADHINAILEKHPKIAAAIENTEIAMEELGEIEKKAFESQQKSLVNPNLQVEIFTAQKRIAVSLDALTRELTGVKDQQILSIAMSTHRDASAYLQAIVLSIHYTRHAQKNGTNHICERIFSEAYALLQRQQERMVQQQKSGNSKLIIP